MEPFELNRVMLDTMSSGVPQLANHLNNDNQKLKRIFKNYILKSPLNENLLNDINLNGNPLLEMEIKFLHHLYNNPDETSRVSSINDQKDSLKAFRDMMLLHFKIIKKTIPNCIPNQNSPQKDQPSMDTSEWEAPAKSGEKENVSDEELAKNLQQEFDKEQKGIRISTQDLRGNSVVFKVGSANLVNSSIFVSPGSICIHNTGGYNNKKNYSAPKPNEIDLDEEYARNLQQQLDAEQEGQGRGNTVVVAGGDISMIGENLFIDGRNKTHRSTSSDIKSQKTAEKGTYKVRPSEKLNLPNGSNNCVINGGACSKITVGSNSSDIRIDGGASSTITINNNCKDMTIKLKSSAKAHIGDNCENITITLGASAIAKIGNNCKNIKITADISSEYVLGDNCKNVYVNGQKVA